MRVGHHVTAVTAVTVTTFFCFLSYYCPCCRSLLRTMRSPTPADVEFCYDSPPICGLYLRLHANAKQFTLLIHGSLSKSSKLLPCLCKCSLTNGGGIQTQQFWTFLAETCHNLEPSRLLDRKVHPFHA